MTKTQPTVAELRDQAEVAGIHVPDKATRAALEKLLGHEPETKTQPTVADGQVEVRKPIEYTTERGDWKDPFSGLIVYYGTEKCIRSGAVRDGDEAFRFEEAGAHGAE